MRSIHSTVYRIIQTGFFVYRRTLSPDHGPGKIVFGNTNCIFFPSCSVYAEEAIRRYGFLKGIGLALGRISRCHPWSAGGYDPVR